MIFNGTLKENLIYGSDKDLDDSLLNDYINKFKVFNIDSEINLTSNISNKTLSSGQMQKISFIRALLIKPDILLLDESTSNLDIESKELIFSILNELDLTIINSTHNLSSFIDYDEHFEIVNSENGRVLISN